MNPYPNPRSVLVMDNCTIHWNGDIAQLVRDYRCRVVFTPEYTPRFQPCELLFGNFKRHLKRNGFPQHLGGPELALLLELFDYLSPDIINSCVRACGYFENP